MKAAKVSFGLGLPEVMQILFLKFLIYSKTFCNAMRIIMLPIQKVMLGLVVAELLADLNQQGLKFAVATGKVVGFGSCADSNL